MKDRQTRDAKWLAAHAPLDMARYADALLAIIRELQSWSKAEFSRVRLRQLLGRYPRDGKQTFSRDQLVRGYRALCRQGKLEFDRETLRRLQRKPTRTLSGVAPVAVLTKAYPCPGECVFCPDDEDMPKSYLSDEPGAQRGAFHSFDPFAQTAGRIHALGNIGHPTDKIELIVLGGSWSAYPHDYQAWFVRRCLDAMNGREARTLLEAQHWNESAAHRNVGLVVETRPDLLTADEVLRLRQLGVTKVQMGVQSLDDAILARNRRGHTLEHTRRATRLLRLAGFKIAFHWMPNLLGATPASDKADFAQLWSDPALCPDEIKIYPCVLLKSADLYQEWQQGHWTPYSEQTLVDLVAELKPTIPMYCRVNRVNRDIPAGYIVAGCKRANLRQLAQQRMRQLGGSCRCIRCREVRGEQVEPDKLFPQTLVYATDVGQEYWLCEVTQQGRLVGFLRLLLPKRGYKAGLTADKHKAGIVAEIIDCAMIREVHVYGPALTIGADSIDRAQHQGVGERLIGRAQQIAQQNGFGRLAVIAAVGTRNYYRRRGFSLGELYMAIDL